MTTTLPIPNSTNVHKTAQWTWDTSHDGNVLLIKDWNYYTGSLPTNADRTSTIAFLSGTSYQAHNIVNHPTSVTVTDKNGNTVAKTTYAYDGTTPVSVTGITHHDDTNYGTSNNVRANITQVQQLISGTSNYLTKTMTYDMTGQVRTATDPNGNHTTLSYTDSFYKDNNSNPPSPYSSSATNAYPTTVTPAISSLASTFSYYFGTGQLAIATGPNGNITYSHFGSEQEFVEMQ